LTTAEANRQPRGAFGALSSRSYRIYIAGQSLANTGAWMQTIAQDWLIFNLTHSSAAVGVTMALQFLPLLLLGLQAGAIADRLPKRRILLITQTLNAAATATLAVMTISGAVGPTEVYAFALVSGVIFAFDSPTRQVFVAEVVPPEQLRAGIALNAAVFQSTRLIGPALASVLIVTAGTGWVFAVNAACYLGPTIGLLRLRPADLIPVPAAPRGPRALRTAARHLRERPDVLWTIFLVGMVGTFGLNFPIVLTAMAKTTFHGTASTYGLFNIVLAVGSMAGALFGGATSRTRTWVLIAAAAGFGLFQAADRPGPAVLPGAARPHGLREPGVPGHGERVRAARRGPGAARPCDGALHAGLRRRHADRRPDHRRAHEPPRAPGGDGRLRRRAGDRRPRHGRGHDVPAARRARCPAA
jgi:MFS family permease